MKRKLLRQQLRRKNNRFSKDENRHKPWRFFYLLMGCECVFEPSLREMKMKTCSAIVVILFLQSCNFLKIVDRTQEKKFRKNQINLYHFKDQVGVHSVHYSGNGKPKLMMIHGYGASGIGQYYRSAIELNESYDLILPDLMYCGKSFGDSTDYSIDLQVMHIKTILDSLNIHEPVTVIGNSYGGIVSAYFAEKFPELVNKLIIYDSPVNFYTGTYADSISKSVGVCCIQNILSPTTIFENKESLDMVFYDQPYIPRFLRRQMVKYGSVPARPNQLQLLDYLLEREVQFNDHHFDWKMPVYLCWGEFDILIPRATCQNIMLRYQIPDDHLYIFPKAAHAANVEYPLEFASYLRMIMQVGND